MGIALMMACVPPIPSLAEDDVDEETSPKQERLPPTEDASHASEEDASTEVCKTNAPNHRCGLAPQCGCLPNETCDVLNELSGVVSCVASGTGTLGRPCTSTSDCLAGLGCFFGACRPYCDNPMKKCSVAGTELCVRYSDDLHENLNFCTIMCDPREPAGVCGANSCLWFPSLYETHKITDCDVSGTFEETAACTYDWECKPGLRCQFNPSQGLSECMRWCRIGVGNDCSPQFTCQDVLGEDAPVINGAKYGVCLDPF